MNTATKLWNKNFILYVTSFEFSLVGDSLLRFAIPIYILTATNNPALLGTVMTLSWAPNVLFTPIGGVMADRLDKRKMMILFNFLIATVIGAYIFLTGTIDSLGLSLTILVAVTILQSLQSSSFETAVYTIIPMEDLLKANSVTFVLMIGSGILAPIVAGFMLAEFGLTSIIYSSLAFFGIGTLLNYLMKIPHDTIKVKTGLFQTLLIDTRESYRFIRHKNPTMGRMTIGLFLYALVLIPALTFIPSVLINSALGMSEQSLGFANGLIAGGGVLGVVALGAFEKKITIPTLPKLLVASALSLITTIVLFMTSSGYIAFAILITGLLLVNSILVIYSMTYFTYLGQNTPEDIVGKIMALAMTVMTLGGTLSMFVVGRLFSLFENNLEIATLILPVAVLISAFLTVEKRKSRSD